jgi:hypothetical protein
MIKFTKLLLTLVLGKWAFDKVVRILSLLNVGNG